MAAKKSKGGEPQGMKKKTPFLSTKTLTLDGPNQKKRSKKSKRGERKAEKKERRKQMSGPRLSSSLKKELDLLNPNPRDESQSDEEDNDGDVYEYEEGVAEEESKKNRRYDPVEDLGYELPHDFKDEDVPSDGDEEIASDRSEESDDEGDRHRRMLAGITGMPGEAFDGKERKKVVLSDLQWDSGDGNLSITDFLDPLYGMDGYGELRKRVAQQERNPMAVQPPLPKVERERVERKVAYEHSKKDITKWEPLVKRNREAPTLYFEEDVDLGFSTVGAIASEFEPRTEFEKKMASLVSDPDVVDAHSKDGARLLELNKISVEDVRDRQNCLAKMRSLLFRHEMKAKHIKKIKSKTYHRILKKEKLKAASAEMEMDPEAIKESARKQEFKRAEERMRLKHKNSSKWAKRILKRGLQVQDEGTRNAISEQLVQHALLTRKINSVKESSSSDDSSDDDDDLSPGAEDKGVSMLLNRAKEKTLKVMEEEDEIPKSGVLVLPFMERALKKQKAAADEEACLALQEYESTLAQVEGGDQAECQTSYKASGRKVFGPTGKQSQDHRKKIQSADVNSSDSEYNIEAAEHGNGDEVKNGLEDKIGTTLLYDESEVGQEVVFKDFNDIVKDPGPKTTYEVAMFVSDSWKKMKSENGLDASSLEPAAVDKNALVAPDSKDLDQSSDSDSDDEMVDGILSSGVKPDYELPSQVDLIHQAFAGDDVEAEFEKDKMEILNEENPEPEKPVLLPGWGQWTHVQQKKGMPSWMLKEHEEAKRKREETLKKRKDANLKRVIISEKIDKKAEKLHANHLPYPYTSKEVYEQSIRMPIGPEYNPAISVGALNRPAIVKKAGMIIKPIKYEEVDPHEKAEEPKQRGQKSKAKRTKSAGGNASKRARGKQA